SSASTSAISRSRPTSSAAMSGTGRTADERSAGSSGDGPGVSTCVNDTPTLQRPRSAGSQVVAVSFALAARHPGGDRRSLLENTLHLQSPAQRFDPVDEPA